jgi:hypothetical protein
LAAPPAIPLAIEPPGCEPKQVRAQVRLARKYISPVTCSFCSSTRPFLRAPCGCFGPGENRLRCGKCGAMRVDPQTRRGTASIYRHVGGADRRPFDRPGAGSCWPGHVALYNGCRRARPLDRHEQGAEAAGQLPVASHRPPIHTAVCGEHQRRGVELEDRLAFVEVAGREP